MFGLVCLELMFHVVYGLVNLQSTVAGVLGVNGMHALKRVATVHSTAVASAINQVQHMEESNVQGQPKRHENVTLRSVQVGSLFAFINLS